MKTVDMQKKKYSFTMHYIGVFTTTKNAPYDATVLADPLTPDGPEIANES